MRVRALCFASYGDARPSHALGTVSRVHACSRRVSLDDRYGTCPPPRDVGGFRSAGEVAASARLFSLPRGKPGDRGAERWSSAVITYMHKCARDSM